MDPQVSGSFIPKAPLTQTRRAGGGMGLFLLISIVLFVLSLAGAAGVFAYEGLLNAQVASRDDQLRRAEGAFEPRVIEDLSRLDNRLLRARELLQRHLAPSGIFDFLSQATLEQVQFTKFSYRIEGQGSAVISLTGSADTFSTVALQSDQFGSARLLKNVVFSNVVQGGVGGNANKVSFEVKAELDPSLFIYARQDNTAVPTQTQTPAVPASTSTPQ